MIQALRILLRERRDEIAHPESDLAILHGLVMVMVMVMVVAAVREWLLFEDLRLYPASPTDDALAEELARTFVAYPGASGPGPRKPKRKPKRRKKK